MDLDPHCGRILVVEVGTSAVALRDKILVWADDRHVLRILLPGIDRRRRGELSNLAFFREQPAESHISFKKRIARSVAGILHRRVWDVRTESSLQTGILKLKCVGLVINLNRVRRGLAENRRVLSRRVPQ
jgi:hypothetical protein